MSVVTVIVAAAGLLTGGAGMAWATDPNNAPPGYDGPSSYCRGSQFDAIGLGDGHAYIDVYWEYSYTGGGHLCAMTYDVAEGRHNMEVRIRRTDWVTPWYDNGYYDRYAGAITVHGMEYHCAYISGWIEHDGRRYSNGETICP